MDRKGVERFSIYIIYINSSKEIFPSLLINILWKFHLGIAEFPKLFFAHKNIECAFEPLTSTLCVNGKLTLKFTSQNFLISLFVPGSCPPNWLEGTPSTIKPLSLGRPATRAAEGLGGWILGSARKNHGKWWVSVRCSYWMFVMGTRYISPD